MSFMKPDEALFLLLWSSGYIGAKIGLPLAGTFTLLFLRYALVICWWLLWFPPPRMAAPRQWFSHRLPGALSGGILKAFDLHWHWGGGPYRRHAARAHRIAGSNGSGRAQR